MPRRNRRNTGVEAILVVSTRHLDQAGRDWSPLAAGDGVQLYDAAALYEDRGLVPATLETLAKAARDRGCGLLLVQDEGGAALPGLPVFEEG